MATKYRLVTILILFLAGYDQPPATAPQTSPAFTVQTQPSVEPTEPPTPPDAATTPVEQSQDITGKVVGIIDGDTIDILTADKTTIRIRLNGIDAPEMGQPFGRTAKEFLSNSIGGTMVRVVSHGQDRYGRTIGDVFSTELLIDPIPPGQLLTEEDELEELQDLSGLSVTMVMNGLAWHYVKYAPDRKDLADAEKWAKSERLRLWSDPRHIAPWEWRKLSKAERDKLR